VQVALCSLSRSSITVCVVFVAQSAAALYELALSVGVVLHVLLQLVSTRSTHGTDAP
jgi:hypothetical protein